MSATSRWRLLPVVVACVALVAPAGLSGIAADGSWGPTMNLSVSEVFTEDASLAVDSQGRVHVVWTEGGELFHRYRLAESWSPAAAVAVGFAPCLAAGADDQVHLAFVNRFSDVDDIYYTSWRAEGGWQLAVNVSEGVDRSSSPALFVATDGTKAVAWGSRSGESDLIYAAVSGDGVLWASGPVPQAFGVRPQVALSEGDLLVAWQGPYDVPGSASEVFVSRQSGQAWTLPVDVSASPEVDSVLASLALAAETNYLAWQENLPGSAAVFVSLESSGVWSVPEKRSAGSPAFAPALTVAGDTGHLTWATGTGVQYASWTVSTGSWQPVETAAVDQTAARDACITAKEWPHLAWLAEASPDNDDVFYCERVGGATPTPSATLFPTPSQTLSPTPTATSTVTQTIAPSATPSPTGTLSPQLLIFLPIIRAHVH